MLKKRTAVIFFVIQAIAEAVLVLSLIKADMFPKAYIITAIVFGVFLLFFTWSLSFAKLKNKKKGVIIFRRIISALIAVAMLVVSAFSWLVINKVGDTITGITTKKTVTKVVGVYVLADDPAQKIEDAKGYSFGYCPSYDSESINETVKDIEKQIGAKPNTQEYSDSMEMMADLYDGSVKAIIMNESYASVIEDQDKYQNFETDTKLIYEYKIVTNVKANDKGDRDLSSFVIYLSGSDTRSKMLDVSRSDVNILMAVNTETKEILLLNTPRDYFVPISISSSGARDKLTHCGIYGVECSMDTLSALYNQDIDYYAQINFSGFETLIDAVGGITVYSDTAFSVGEFSYSQGDNYVNGIEALTFARDRNHQAGGDRGRGNNQMKVITAVIEKMTTGTALTHFSEILNSLQGMFVTDMSSAEINSLVKMQLSDMSSWNIHSYAVTGADGSSTTYSIPGSQAYVMYPNQQMVKHASELMTKVLDGETLSDADVA